jgi:hypothetical protein
VTDSRRTFIVDRADWRKHRLIEAPLIPLADGEVRLRIDRFALTSNNVSYAVAGDLLGYWDFFPIDEAGWGCIPVMGFADVADSRHPDIAAGTRVFGFFPISTFLQVPAGAVSAAGFADVSAHRANHAPAYVQFSDVRRAPMYDAALEDPYLLLRGLFTTSFLADDFLADRNFRGATSVVVTSASSKTAIALAFQLARRPEIEAIGLTSARNAAFVESLGLYRRVVTYEQLESLPAQIHTAVVDMAGNRGVIERLHRHFANNLVYDCTIGATHWQEGGAAAADLPGAAPEFFFAPSQIQKRSQDWGPQELQNRIAADYRQFVESTRDWLEIARGYGPDAVAATYERILDGEAAPSEGHVLSMWESRGTQ